MRLRENARTINVSIWWYSRHLDLTQSRLFLNSEKRAGGKLWDGTFQIGDAPIQLRLRQKPRILYALLSYMVLVRIDHLGWHNLPSHGGYIFWDFIPRGVQKFG